MILSDTTARKKAEEELYQAEMKYRTLVDNIPAITYTATLDGVGNTKYVSPQIEGILGFSQEEWLANYELWANQIHTDDRKRVLIDYADSCAKGKQFRAEYRIMTRNGCYIWAQDGAVIIDDEKCKSRYMQGVVLDITERKQMEEQIKDRTRKLETLNKITASINKAEDLKSLLECFKFYFEVDQF